VDGGRISEREEVRRPLKKPLMLLMLLMLLMQLHGLFVREYVFSPSKDSDGATLYVFMYVCTLSLTHIQINHTHFGRQ
jgi:hypothetical protein